MVIGASLSGTEVPLSEPRVTMSLAGVPRFGLAGFAGRGPRLVGVGRLVWAVFRGAGRRPGRAPKMSERIPEIAGRTDSHSTARKPSRMTVRVSSDIRVPTP